MICHAPYVHLTGSGFGKGAISFSSNNNAYWQTVSIKNGKFTVCLTKGLHAAEVKTEPAMYPFFQCTLVATNQDFKDACKAIPVVATAPTREQRLEQALRNVGRIYVGGQCKVCPSCRQWPHKDMCEIAAALENRQ